MLHDHLFAVQASKETEKAVSTLEGPTAAPGKKEKATLTLEALVSALVNLSEPDLERQQAAKR